MAMVQDCVGHRAWECPVGHKALDSGSTGPRLCMGQSRGTRVRAGQDVSKLEDREPLKEYMSEEGKAEETGRR